MNSKIQLGENDILYKIEIKNKNVALYESHGVIIIDTTTMCYGDKTFSDIVIYRTKNQRCVVHCIFQKVQSAAQVKKYIQDNIKFYKTIPNGLKSLGIDEKDYSIETFPISEYGTQSDIVFNTQKLITKSKFPISFDCINYAIIKD